MLSRKNTQGLYVAHIILYTEMWAAKVFHIADIRDS